MLHDRILRVTDGYLLSSGNVAAYCSGCTSFFTKGFADDLERSAFTDGVPFERRRVCTFMNGNPTDRCSGHSIKFAGRANTELESWLQGDETDWPKEPNDFFKLSEAVPDIFDMEPDTEGDLVLYQTVPNRLAPERLWIASGEKISQLPESEDWEVILAGYASNRFAALHAGTCALVLFTMENFSPYLALRLACREYWQEHYGCDWWKGHNLTGILISLMKQASATKHIWTYLVQKRRAWHIDDALERMTIFEPEDLDQWSIDQPNLELVGYDEFTTRKFQPAVHLLEPWLTVPGLSMVFAERGVGKTMFTASVALAVATGTSFLGWKAGRPRRVLIIDGEMPAADLKERYLRIAEAMGCSPSPENLVFLSADLSLNGLPDLGTDEGQRALEEYLQGFDLIIIDNLSTLVRSGAENEADSWGIVQAWAIRQRSAGRSVLLVHHSGKNGAQRGTSRREDVLGTVIQLKRPAGYNAADGAKFEIHFTKTRGFYGPAAEPIEAQLHSEGSWSWSPVNQAQAELAAELFQKGETVRDVATKLGVSTSTISKWLKESGLKPQRGRRPKAD